MRSERIGRISDPLQAMFLVGAIGSRSDSDLLATFRDSSGMASNVAFEVLVRRHGPMVFGVCRRILVDHQAAEDAFQATFFILARKAGSVRSESSLSRWLYGVSRKVAGRARSRQKRTREPFTHELVAPIDDAPDRDDLRRAVIQEVERLPRKYREAIHLCHLDGLTHDRAAAILKLPVGTVRSRLSRGRDLLRSRFARRGIAPAAVLAVLEGSTTHAAVPSAWVKTTTKLALSFSVGEHASCPATLTNLATSTLRNFSMMKWTMILAACLATSATGTVITLAAHDKLGPNREIAPTARTRPKTLRERYEEIQKELERRDEAFFKAYKDTEEKTKKVESDEQKRQIRKEGMKDAPYVRHSREYMKRFESIAIEAPDDPVALEALYSAYQSIGHPSQIISGKEESYAEYRENETLSYAILDRMVRYADDPRMRNYLQQIGLEKSTHSEHLCREVLARNKDHEALGHATQALANCMLYLAAMANTAGWSPEAIESMKKVTPAEELDRQKGRNSASMDAEGEALHEKVVAEFADVRVFPAADAKKNPWTIAKQSIDWLADRRELSVGKPAPLFTGKDLDGKEFSLKDYRGKVVALVFWASWCGPCMLEVPHERELAKAMEGKPFALLGVNSDYTPDNAKQAIAEEKITWPNWYDGDPRRSRPVGDAYSVLGIPAIFVLDGDGVIRFKGVRDKKLVEAVETLLKEKEVKETNEAEKAKEATRLP